MKERKSFLLLIKIVIKNIFFIYYLIYFLNKKKNSVFFFLYLSSKKYEIKTNVKPELIIYPTAQNFILFFYHNFPKNHYKFIFNLIVLLILLYLHLLHWNVT